MVVFEFVAWYNGSVCGELWRRWKIVGRGMERHGLEGLETLKEVLGEREYY